MKKQKLGCYAGLDLSLAGTGGVLLDDQGEVISVLAFSTSKREAAASGKNSRTHILLSPEVKQGDPSAMWARTVAVRNHIDDWLCMWAEPNCLVGIEDHAFGARGTSIYQLGHLHGLVRHLLQIRGHQWLLIAPTELKAAVTGKGNADKAAMMKVPTPKLNQKSFGSSTRNNVVDAYWLAMLTAGWGEEMWPEMPSTFDKVLSPHGKKPGLLSRKVLP